MDRLADRSGQRGRERAVDLPDEPSEDDGFYRPVDGISVRDHVGRRWRVVHHQWDGDELRTRLSAFGWALEILGDGHFGEVAWCLARRAGEGGPR